MAILAFFCKTSLNDLKNLESIKLANEKVFALSVLPLNELLGFGVHEGSKILLAGEPGCGKSTLLLQLVKDFQIFNSVLYFSLEENLSGVKKRAERLGVKNKNLLLSVSYDLSIMTKEIENANPDIIIIDSLQMIISEQGSVKTMKNALSIFLEKFPSKTVFIISHINKEGKIAGSKFIEHMVDVVLMMENVTKTKKRVHSIKNRFSSLCSSPNLLLTNKGFEA